MEVSGSWLKKKHEYKKQKFTAFQNVQRARNRHYSISARTSMASVGTDKFHSKSNDSPDLMSVKSRLNISRIN